MSERADLMARRRIATEAEFDAGIEAGTPCRAFGFAVCLVSVFVFMPLVMIANGGWVSDDDEQDEDDKQQREKHPTPDESNWAADAIFITIYICIKLCECLPRRAGFQQRHETADETTPMMMSGGGHHTGL